MDRVLALVRTAYRPHRRPFGGASVNLPDYDTYHAEFLAMGCRWNTARQMYVRKDGVVLADPIVEFPQHRYRFPAIPRHAVTVVFWRGDAATVDYEVDFAERGKGKIGNAIVVVQDASSGQELGWMPLCDRDPRLSWDERQVLAGPPHRPEPGGTFSSGFELAKGKRVRFAIEFGGRRYVSPVYRP